MEMGETTSDHQLWVSLNALGEGNVFELLPDLLKKMLSEYDSSDMDDDFFDVILPSDDEWRTKIYYKLVEKQRLSDNSEETMLDYLEEEKNTKLHDWNIRPKSKVVCKPLCLQTIKKKRDVNIKKITWTVGDIAKAGCLLQNPPLNTEFEDEQEMRRVYTLIYDAFRYKNVLTEALNNVSFFGTFPSLIEKAALVWLFLYDLYHRRFSNRETKVQELANKLFDATGLTFIENALWTQRIKLAAAISRQRIKNNALTLSDLLPPHLQDDRVIGNETTKPICCWINTMKVENPDTLCQEIEEEFELHLVEDSDELDRDSYKWDKHCPQIVEFHNSMRAKLSKSSLIKNYKLILQDRSFCLGPATFDKLIGDLELAGSVIQTHVNSPRTTAYLAVLLSHNEKIKKLLAFSAGQRKVEYESYFNQLGMNNILIFAERLIDTRPDAQYMEEVVAVFATPPNSYSAVADPIDLVCSRGGDLSMLQVLTDSEDTQEGKDRVASVLEEQRRTLRFAMSRPQIQFVLYETHSELDAENSGMVNKALNDINKVAKIHHATLQGKLTLPTVSETEVNNNEKGDTSCTVSKRSSIMLKSTISDEKILENIKVPATDLFDVPNLPVLCPSNKQCANLPKDGCFLSLIQRKQIIRLDDKYMIQMAENRGLFGNNAASTRSKSKSSRASKKKVEKEEEKPKKSRKKLKDEEVERVEEVAPDDPILTSNSNFLTLKIPETEEEVEKKDLLSKPKEMFGPNPQKSCSFKILRYITNSQIRPFICPFYKPPKEIKRKIVDREPYGKENLSVSKRRVRSARKNRVI